MKRVYHKKLIFCILFILVIASFLFSIYFGNSKITFSDIFTTILNPNSANASIVIFQIRLPRIILAGLCGMGLALSGCTLQSVTGNYLADPGILGINSGAGFMVMIFMSFFPNLHIKTMVYQPLFAMIGGLLVVIFLYYFSKRNGKIRPSYLLLGGIGIGAGFNAAIIIMGSNMDSSSYQLVSRWLVGNIWGTSWQQVKTLLPYFIILVPFFLIRLNILDIFFLGEETAISLGVRVEIERRVLVIVAVLIAACCVSVSGGIGFIGLVAPHIARKLVGARHKNLLPASMLVGSFFLIMSDTIGRTLIKSIEIPVGIVISIFAAPYFIYLLYKQY